jgi:hypothetical protein
MMVYGLVIGGAQCASMQVEGLMDTIICPRLGAFTVNTRTTTSELATLFDKNLFTVMPSGYVGIN